jgi:3'5'-cyclic nucleotide phosphodiesterase
VFAKGKGMMTCFWCEPKAESVHSLESGSTLAENTPVSCPEPNPLQDRLIDWNVDMFTGLLKDVMKRRNGSENKMNEWSSKASADLRTSPGQPIHEINDVLSCLNQKTKLKPSRRELDVHPKVAKQLRELIAAVANLYLPNPFHNFEHCSHVAMSTKKLLDRIAEQEVASQNDVPSIATNSCGMFADPLTRFAMVFAALIHDVDHPGVSNAQLVQERHGLALAYSDRSAAEQNSIDASWDLLMSPKYADLRGTLFSSKSDLVQFRQVVVNVVLATDLFDKDFKAMREARWETSFHVDSFGDKDAAKRRATIIIDLVIQASDVSHTMQHFTVYKKWNMCLLAEMYAAFKNGRTFKDPTEGWYEGELWFFDNYVIPLAERLRECEVFGVSGDEFLDYAKGNRLEWAANGREIVRSAVESLAGSYR